MDLRSGGEQTPLSILLEVLPSEVINMSRSPYLTIGYLLKYEREDLEFNSL